MEHFLSLLVTFQIIVYAWPQNIVDVEGEFNVYIKKFRKNYTNDTKEYWRRLDNFKNTLQRIEKFHQQPWSQDAQFGWTQYSDLSPEEFRQTIIKTSSPESAHFPHLTKNVYLRKKRNLKTNMLKDIPQKFDWRDHSVVTAVKNQKSCGACWAFSTVETIETMKAMKTGKLQEFSVQQVIDCAAGGNHGCTGGDTCNVLAWMNSTNFAITTEALYPLTDVYGTCKQTKGPEVAEIYGNFTCERYVGNEDVMVQLLAEHGPLVTAVDATTWQDYVGGVIQYHCDILTNHAVQIVGYDLTGDVPYYIVRNSWGEEFGLNGYLHVAIGKDLCAIAERVSILDVKG